MNMTARKTAIGRLRQLVSLAIWEAARSVPAIQSKASGNQFNQALLLKPCGKLRATSSDHATRHNGSGLEYASLRGSPCLSDSSLPSCSRSSVSQCPHEKKKRGQATFQAMFVAVRGGAAWSPGPRWPR